MDVPVGGSGPRALTAVRACRAARVGTAGATKDHVAGQCSAALPLGADPVYPMQFLNDGGATSTAG
jgi:hypothetical protein